MKKLIIVFLLLFFILSPAYAHMPGQPPFFMIDRVFTEIYPVPLSNNPDMLIPQDNAPSLYIVGETIDFEIDTTQLGVPEEVVRNTTFRWDMGNGTKKTGLENTYSYSKAGSYFLTVYAEYEDSPQPILLQSTLINIVSDKNFEVPKAIITVNGRQTTDSLNEVLKLSYQKPLKFDAGKSTGEIESVLWDFGEGNPSTEVSTEHQYNAELGGIVFPILQVKFKNGFISHAFVQIDKDDSLINEQGIIKQKESFPFWVIFVLMGVVFIAVGFYVYKKRRH